MTAQQLKNLIDKTHFGNIRAFAAELSEVAGVEVAYMTVYKHVSGESGIGVGFRVAYSLFERVLQYEAEMNLKQILKVEDERDLEGH